MYTLQTEIPLVNERDHFLRIFLGNFTQERKQPLICHCLSFGYQNSGYLKQLYITNVLLQEFQCLIVCKTTHFQMSNVHTIEIISECCTSCIEISGGGA